MSTASAMQRSFFDKDYEVFQVFGRRQFQPFLGKTDSQRLTCAKMAMIIDTSLQRFANIGDQHMKASFKLVMI